MKSVLSLLLASLLCVSLVFTLTACDLGFTEKLDFMGQSNSSSAPSSPAPSSPAPSTESSGVLTGKTLELSNRKLTSFPDRVLGTENELRRWEEVVQSQKVVHIEVCNMNSEEKELPPGNAASIMDILTSADVKLFDSLGNPSTGGGIHVIAFDESGDAIFHIVYDGEWFSVQFEDETSSYVFDGTGGSLNTLPDYIP